MADKLAIHIPPEATPDNIAALIRALVETDRPFNSVKELLDFMETSGIGSRTEIQSTAEGLGLIEKTENGIQCSERGRAFSRIKETVHGEILHYLMYTSWDPQQVMTSFRPSWAYKTICDEYWRSETITLSREVVSKQVAEIINHAEQAFVELGLGKFDSVSFSDKSLRGARKWLDALTPPVITNDKFERRAFCSPELMLLTIGYTVRDEPDAIDIDILLSRSRIEDICRVCLLDPTVFDQTLDWMFPLFPKVIVSTEDAGYYGRYIRLRKRPTLEDLIR